MTTQRTTAPNGWLFREANAGERRVAPNVEFFSNITDPALVVTVDYPTDFPYPCAYLTVSKSARPVKLGQLELVLASFKQRHWIEVGRTSTEFSTQVAFRIALEVLA